MIRTSVQALGVAPVMRPAAVTTSDWRQSLPVLCANGITLRELRISDAASLHAHLTAQEVARFISPPPSTVEGFERFIAWTHAERAAGCYACFAVVPDGMTDAIGLFQIRQLVPTFEIAEWGFALGQSFWGTGIFAATAAAAIDFAIDHLQVRRLEARSSVLNGRGNGALQKIGATREALLRKSFIKDGVAYDQVLWSIVADDWRMAARRVSPLLH